MKRQYINGSSSTFSQDILNDELSYDPVTGELHWKLPDSGRDLEKRAGGIKGRYRYITVRGVSYLEHRLIWIMMHGSIPDGREIDHINRDGCDNRLENLRLVTRRENVLNSGVVSSDCSKYPGVTKSKSPGKWCVGLHINSNRVNLGTYTTEEGAYNVYCQAMIEYSKLKLVNDGRVRASLDIGGVRYMVVHERDNNRLRNKWVYKVVHYRGGTESGVSKGRYAYKSASEAKAAGSQWLLAKELHHIMRQRNTKETS